MRTNTQLQSINIEHLLQYPYVNEFGDGCDAVVKRHGLYIKCNNQCNDNYCTICCLNLNRIDIQERVMGGFVKKTPNNFTKMKCFKKTMRKMGYTIHDLKKEANKLKRTLNMDFIEEMCKTKTKRSIKNKKKIEDVSVVDDSDDENEPRIVRGRGRPKNLNTKNNEDLIDDLINADEEEEINVSDSDSDDGEIIVQIFDYTGDQDEFKDLSLYIDENDIVYNNLGELLGNYFPQLNKIIDRLA
tara:strand:+ start:965 stop:1693 length:729 start_codon:yes stop_codon:yes gene_type:complete